MFTRIRSHRTKILVALFAVFVLSLTSCHKSYFQLLTNDSKAYWRKGKTSSVFYSFSKKDSLSVALNTDLTPRCQLVHVAKYGEKFKFMGDTLLIYVKDNEDFYFQRETLIVSSLTKNNLIFHVPDHPEYGESEWTRLRHKEVRYRRELRFKNWHRYELLTRSVVVSLPADYTDYMERKEEYENGVAYYITGLGDGSEMVISEGEIPDEKNYMKRYSGYNPVKHISKKHKEIYYGKIEDWYCRKDVFDNVSVSYNFVKPKYKGIYERVLNELKLLPVN